MPSYGSLHSPSLKKMEHTRVHYNRKGANKANLLGDPFFLVTLSISLIAWVISLIASAYAAAHDISDPPTFPKYAWWLIIYSFFLDFAVCIVVLYDAIPTYHVALSSFCAGGIVMTTSIVNSVIYSRDNARVASGVGFIIISIVLLLWTFYFGAAPSATPRAYIDSFALNRNSDHVRPPVNTYNGNFRPETSISVQPPQIYTAQLNGLENTSPHINSSVGPNRAPVPALPGFANVPAPHPIKPPGSATADTEVVPPTEYPYHAKAIYSYDANPEDSNEISFAKHQVLEISDVSGRWWQARKESGETGIAPSNYLILL